jgi:hypothetical protein
MSKNYDSGELKEKLRPALEELEAIGFLKPMDRSERYIKLAKGQWRVVFVSGRTGIPQLPKPELRPDGIARELIDRGVTPSVAEELTAHFPEDVITRRIDVSDWMAESKGGRGRKSPVGYLVESIRQGYAVPKGFVSRSERESRKRAQASKDEALNRSKEDASRQKAKEKAVVEYWNSLDLDAQERLLAQALAAAPDEQRAAYELRPKQSPLRRLAMAIMRDAYIRKILVDKSELRDCRFRDSIEGLR